MMGWQCLAGPTFTILALACGGVLPASAEQPAGNESNRLDELARKLNLTDKQKQQVEKIYADFDSKATPLLRQLCKHRNEQWQGLQSALTEGQRTKLKEAIKAQADKELQSIARKLNLSEEQTKRVERIRQDFWKKFLKVCTQQGANMARDYRELSMDATLAGREVLTDEQRAKLATIQRQDFDELHDFIFRHEHLKALGKQLGLSDGELNKLRRVCAAHEKKMEQPMAQLKELCTGGCASLQNVLNAEQRIRFHEVFPFHFLQAEQSAPEKRQP
jgi:Spy/CpxP family protein refolding chaperone